MMMNRIERLAAHLSSAEPADRSPVFTSLVAGSSRNPNDVVIVSALRTPICKAKRGAFKNTSPDDLLGAVFKATIERTGIDPSLINDIVVGNVLQDGAGAVSSRLAQLVAGIPFTVPLSSINRQCSSGLQAVANAAAAIQSGMHEIVLAAGVESMSKKDMSGSVPDVNFEKIYEVDVAKDAMTPMGMTSENVAEKYGITRAAQDALAARSHARAAAAQKAGKFVSEIVPVTVRNEDGEDVVVREDEGIREGTTAEALGKLRPAFKEDGSTTAGNSSQVSDGAAAVLLMRRSTALRLGLRPLAAFRSYAVVGVPPDVMGIGPAVAIPRALQAAGVRVEDVSVFELNEAFASQACYCAATLRLPEAKVNPVGGAIALGHPLGCTGARQIATLLPELARTGGRYGVVSMCIGTGMGAAAVLESEA